jgi:hypothetical protein
MKNYYIRSKNGGIEEVSEVEYFSIVGDKDHRSYASKLYNGSITINEVPEDKQTTVQNIVNNKIAKYGSYGAQLATLKDIEKLANILVKSNLTKGELNQLISALSTLREDATDATASRTIGAYPHLKQDGSLIKAGTRIQWAGVIKRAAVDLWDTVENNPDDAPTLWEDINYQDGYRIIPEVITVGTAFAKDECGWWKYELYKSLLDANVYTPEAYPAGWEKVEV